MSFAWRFGREMHMVSKGLKHHGFSSLAMYRTGTRKKEDTDKKTKMITKKVEIIYRVPYL
jgi:hypothetical protein